MAQHGIPEADVDLASMFVVVYRSSGPAIAAGPYSNRHDAEMAKDYFNNLPPVCGVSLRHEVLDLDAYMYFELGAQKG